MSSETADLPIDASEIVHQDDLLRVVERQAPLAYDPGYAVRYRRSYPQDGDGRVLLWEKGYHNGCDDKLPVMQRLAEHGIGGIFVGQQRHGIARSPRSGWPDAVRTLAL